MTMTLLYIKFIFQWGIHFQAILLWPSLIQDIGVDKECLEKKAVKRCEKHSTGEKFQSIQNLQVYTCKHPKTNERRMFLFFDWQPINDDDNIVKKGQQICQKFKSLNKVLKCARRSLTLISEQNICLTVSCNHLHHYSYYLMEKKLGTEVTLTERIMRSEDQGLKSFLRSRFSRKAQDPFAALWIISF